MSWWKIKVDFEEPFEGSTNSEFTFKPAGDQTEVAWAMHGHHNLIAKAFCLVMNGLDMMGDDLEKACSNWRPWWSRASGEALFASAHVIELRLRDLAVTVVGIGLAVALFAHASHWGGAQGHHEASNCKDIGGAHFEASSQSHADAAQVY
jgi:hypothetical protein